jgi:hypothetical protein
VTSKARRAYRAAESGWSDDEGFRRLDTELEVAERGHGGQQRAGGVDHHLTTA